jgi:hypothetical protein
MGIAQFDGDVDDSLYITGSDAANVALDLEFMVSYWIDNLMP